MFRKGIFGILERVSNSSIAHSSVCVNQLICLRLNIYHYLEKKSVASGVNPQRFMKYVVNVGDANGVNFQY